jgi:hypothetical protein
MCPDTEIVNLSKERLRNHACKSERFQAVPGAESRLLSAYADLDI